MKVSDFDFNLPHELIASKPLAQRDASRMLVIDGDDISDKMFHDFIGYLKVGDVVVFNNSRVIPARFSATDARGHEYEITLHTAVGTDHKTWLGLAKKFNQIDINSELELAEGTKIRVVDKDSESGLTIQFLTDDVFGVLDKVGKMPLPPYIKRKEEPADRDRYQTIYSAPLGSMAAPTAGLHFTSDVIEKIKDMGVSVVNITLHVGSGTWLPVKSEDTRDHKMHSEFGIITPTQADIINKAKKSGGRIIAVGTTSLRLLESAAICAGTNDTIAQFCSDTNIFITPGYKFKVVDILLTNFHLPKSTLFMLVSAFSGLPQMKKAYAHAISERYRFFSYGDCCLLFKND